MQCRHSHLMIIVLILLTFSWTGLAEIQVACELAEEYQLQSMHMGIWHCMQVETRPPAPAFVGCLLSFCGKQRRRAGRLRSLVLQMLLHQVQGRQAAAATSRRRMIRALWTALPSAPAGSGRPSANASAALRPG